MVKVFYKNKSLALAGRSYVGTESKVDKERKDSLDLSIKPENNQRPFEDYKKELSKCLANYIKKYPDINDNYYFGLRENYNLQYYPPGGGFRKWHFERTSPSNSNRVLVFMTYLNTVKSGGGTEFKHQKIITPCEKGLTLLWPPDFTHVHRGQISKKHKKLIATGWYGY
jgi:hypothetical protein